MTSALGPLRIRPGDLLQELRSSDARSGFPNLGDAIYDVMWRRIVNLEFAPGSRLPDDALARELGVSRTPVREALYRLGEVGLVQIHPRRGFFVPTLYREDVVEVYDCRIALESFAARISTPLLDDADIAPHVDRQRRVRETVGAGDPASAEAFVQSDLLLHDLLIQRTGNRRMQQMLIDLRGQLSVVHLWMTQVPDFVARAVEEQGAMLDALLAGDAERAGSAMEAHLQNVKTRVLAGMDLSPRPG